MNIAETLHAEIEAIASIQILLAQASKVSADLTQSTIPELRMHGGYAIGRIWAALEALEFLRTEAEMLERKGKGTAGAP